jgi:hypothetical protein
MKLTIDLDETGYPTTWSGDPDDDGQYTGTIQHAIVAEAARQYRQHIGNEIVSDIRREIKAAREEAIREAMTPIVAEAMAAPIRKTNHYGEPTGPETTLRELVIEEVKKFLSEPTGDAYARDRKSLAQKLVAEEVNRVVSAELKAAINEAKVEAVAVVRDEAAAVVTARLREKLAI